MPGIPNSLKFRALSVLERRGWLTPAAFAVLARMRPVRAAYAYLLRLHRYRLLDRAVDYRGRLLYRLNAKGAARLAWLRDRRRAEGKVF